MNNNTVRFVAIAALILSAAVAGLAQSEVYVSSTQANVRALPKLKAPVVFKVKEGDILTLELATPTDGWYAVRHKKTKKLGWLHKSTIKVIEDDNVSTYTIGTTDTPTPTPTPTPFKMSEEWISLKTSKWLFFRPSSVIVKNQTVRMWGRENNTDGSYDLTLYLFDCSNRTMDFLSLLKYSGKGALPTVYNYAGTSPRPVVPDSVGEGYMIEACKFIK